MRQHRDLAAQTGQVDLCDIGPVDQDPAPLGPVEQHQQIDQCRLARPVRPDQRHRLARRDLQIDTVQRRVASGIGQVDVLEADMPGDRGHRRFIPGRLGWRTQNLFQPGQRAPGLLNLPPDQGQRGKGHRQEDRVQDEGNELGQRHVATGYPLAQQTQDDHHDNDGQEPDDGIQTGTQEAFAHCQRPHPLGHAQMAPGLDPLAGKALDGRHHRQALVHRRDQVGIGCA